MALSCSASRPPPATPGCVPHPSGGVPTFGPSIWSGLELPSFKSPWPMFLSVRCSVPYRSPGRGHKAPLYSQCHPAAADFPTTSHVNPMSSCQSVMQPKCPIPQSSYNYQAKHGQVITLLLPGLVHWCSRPNQAHHPYAAPPLPQRLCFSAVPSIHSRTMQAHLSLHHTGHPAVTRCS